MRVRGFPVNDLLIALTFFIKIGHPEVQFLVSPPFLLVGKLCELENNCYGCFEDCLGNLGVNCLPIDDLGLMKRSLNLPGQCLLLVT